MNVWLSFEFTYLSNSVIIFFSAAFVWLSFEFTYLSNIAAGKAITIGVWLSFEFTYLSNPISAIDSLTRFDYPLNLHISQTASHPTRIAQLFDYPLNLHISQTYRCQCQCRIQFDYPLNLHISQTSIIKTYTAGSLIILWIYISLKHRRRLVRGQIGLIILWIYISLKHLLKVIFVVKVWLSFEFTYLSNFVGPTDHGQDVWLSFEFTYLSNGFH